MFLINLNILPLLKPVISSFRQTEPLPGLYRDLPCLYVSLRGLGVKFTLRKTDARENKSSPDDTGKETAALRKQHFQKAGALTE